MNFRQKQFVGSYKYARIKTPYGIIVKRRIYKTGDNKFYFLDEGTKRYIDSDSTGKFYYAYGGYKILSFTNSSLQGIY